MKLWFLLLGLIFLGSCASISEKTCRAGEWRTVGLKDGEKGKTLEQLIEYQNDCGEYGIQPDKHQYKIGLTQGYLTFCEKKGYSLGKKGDNRSIPILCRDVSTFLPARKKGVQEFCFGKGVEIGKLGVNQYPPRVCKKSLEYDQGIREGLISYCSFENGRLLGKKAKKGKEKVCPKGLKENFINGLNQGIREYCSKRNGFELGKFNGDLQIHVCPKELKDLFKNAYQKGGEYLRSQRKAKTLKQEIEEIQKKLKSDDIPTSTKDYLKIELIKKEVLLKETEKNIHKIEGYIGI